MIAAKRAELNKLLGSGSRDVVQIGQLTLDIHTLETQQRMPSDQRRSRALAILTPEQRAKLGALEQVTKLSAAAYQAVTLRLPDPPPPGRPVPMAAGGLPANVPFSPPRGVPVPLPAPLR